MSILLRRTGGHVGVRREAPNSKPAPQVLVGSKGLRVVPYQVGSVVIHHENAPSNGILEADSQSHERV
jgi:hypothetical protein